MKTQKNINDMWILVILAIVLFVFIIKLIPKTEEMKTVVVDSQHEKQKFLLKYSIAGINMNGCKKKHIGAFIGKIVAEPDNEFDQNAIKIVHKDGTHLGYIPAKETANVRSFIGGNFKEYPCIGEIKFVKDEDFEPIDKDDEPDDFFVGRIYIDGEEL